MARLVLAAALLLATGAVPAAAGWAEADAALQRGDYEAAYREWLPLAERGVAAAQFNLGMLYAQGDGVPQDYVQAHMWFSLAALHFPPGPDRATAEENRDWVAARMTPEQIVEALGLARQWQAKPP